MGISDSLARRVHERCRCERLAAAMRAARNPDSPARSAHEDGRHSTLILPPGGRTNVAGGFSPREGSSLSFPAARRADERCRCERLAAAMRAARNPDSLARRAHERCRGLQPPEGSFLPFLAARRADVAHVNTSASSNSTPCWRSNSRNSVRKSCCLWCSF